MVRKLPIHIFFEGGMFFIGGRGMFSRGCATLALFAGVAFWLSCFEASAQTPGGTPGVAGLAATVPENVTRAINDLKQALSALSVGSDERAASVSATDAMLAQLRGKSADDIVALIGLLSTDLRQNLTDMDKDKISTSLSDLGKQLDAIVAARGHKIHIISAQYGDIRGRSSNRKCDATAYFVGACEGRASCPVAPPNGTADSIDGPTVCGYEPAPLAADGVSFAQVTYKCIYVGFRDFAKIQATESHGGRTINLHKKDKIVCQPPAQ